MKPGDLPPGPWDPGLFRDEDGKTYLYWDSSNVFPMYGAQIDLALDHADEGEGKRVALRQQAAGPAAPAPGPARLGALRPGPYATNSIAPFMEGAWMNRHGDPYYLQYAAPGTEYNVYATGVYTSDKPLGPFHYAPYNPVGYKPGGFVVGAGHGSTFEDAYGNCWNTGTMWVGVNWKFERRIDLFPAGFHDDGQMWVDTRFGDFPQRMPDHKLKPGESTFTGWMLLSWHKHATRLVADCPATVRPRSPTKIRAPSGSPRRTRPGQTLTVDLGAERTVRAVQVNFTDYKSGRYGDAPDIVTQFTLEGSTDGQHWAALADLSHEQRDRPNAYLELDRAGARPLRALCARARRREAPGDLRPARVRQRRGQSAAGAGTGLGHPRLPTARNADIVLEAGAGRGGLQRALGPAAPTACTRPTSASPTSRPRCSCAR